MNTLGHCIHHCVRQRKWLIQMMLLLLYLLIIILVWLQNWLHELCMAIANTMITARTACHCIKILYDYSRQERFVVNELI